MFYRKGPNVKLSLREELHLGILKPFLANIRLGPNHPIAVYALTHCSDEYIL